MMNFSWRVSSWVYWRVLPQLRYSPRAFSSEISDPRDSQGIIFHVDTGPLRTNEAFSFWWVSHEAIREEREFLMSLRVRTDFEKHQGTQCYRMSHVCNHGTDQSDRRMNVARFCDLTCTLELWTRTCFASTESADSSHVRLQISALGLIFAISHGWKFLSFFRAKKLSLRVLFFRAFPVWVEHRFHDDKHNLSW